jgi:carbonic anhydrase
MTISMEKLIDGYKGFFDHYFDEDHPLFRKLSSGQRPSIAVVACSDSRVDPAIILGAEPGDLFVIRNVANLIPPYEEGNGYHGTSAALEFAVTQLKVQHVILFGHSQCGGIRSMLEPIESLPEESFLRKWMELAEPARLATTKECGHQSIDEQVHFCSQQALIDSFRHLQTFPWVKQAEASGELAVHGWYFDIPTGRITTLDAKRGEFVDLL